MKNPFRALSEYLESISTVYRVFSYDRKRFLRHAGAVSTKSRDAQRTESVMGYHVIKKGLTMPNRRGGFGRWTVWHLIDLVQAWQKLYDSQKGIDDGQVRYAAQVLLAYEKMHVDLHYDESKDQGFWQKLHAFSATVPELSPAVEPHLIREQLHSAKSAPFPQFAASRHSIRNFTGAVPIDDIKAAVSLAMTAPSACNRQHTRVHVIVGEKLKAELLSLQQGCRGFGDKASASLSLRPLWAVHAGAQNEMTFTRMPASSS